MRKVLVITYYWPPAGGGGVQRWLKFAKYLPEFGWQPVVYAPEGADYPIVDETLEAEVPSGIQVVRRPILEPRRLYGLVAGNRRRSSEEADEVFHRDASERTWKQNAAVWLRGNLLIPDARVTWVKPSIRFLVDYLSDHPVDAIVTTGPPHSMHLIGRGLKQRTGIPWVADFRDPWTEIEFFDDMRLTKRSEAQHRTLEQAVLEEANAVVTVSPTWGGRFESKARRVEVITNGFDEDDFAGPVEVDHTQFRITHVGSLSMDRNPEVLWQALRSLADERPEFRNRLKIELIGRVDPGVLQSAEDHGLGANLDTPGYVAHADSIAAMQRSAVLLLLINRNAANAPGRIPGKLFEYLAAGRPILLIGPTDGDAATILRKTGAGTAIEFDDVDRIVGAITTWHQNWTGRGTPSDWSSAVRAYSRRMQVAAFSEVLSDVAE